MAHIDITDKIGFALLKKGIIDYETLEKSLKVKESEEKKNRRNLGQILVNDQKEEKCGALVDPQVSLRLLGEAAKYASRGGLKLEGALEHFRIDPDGKVCLDIGASTGGFTDCLLQHGAQRVHAVDTGHGILDWKLRSDPSVVLHERTNLIHWTSPEPLDLIVIDAGWTPQRLSVPAALRSLKPGGAILSLVKPQYEVEKSELHRGVLPPDRLPGALDRVRKSLEGLVHILGEARSPVPGSGGNTEFWLHLRPARY
jgi:23S rRNA (cytidine1920-2'-O)/16S rRNA (cytidine1409-2'-O)-methyltransferase